jgi:hypothetical protein
LLIESGGGSWPDDAKKILLDRILSDNLVKAIITVPSQPDFESYYLILKETDDKLRAYKGRVAKKKTTLLTGNSGASRNNKRTTDTLTGGNNRNTYDY